MWRWLLRQRTGSVMDRKDSLITRWGRAPFQRVFTMITAVALIPPLAIIIATGFEYGAALEEDARDQAVRHLTTLALIQNTVTAGVRQTLSTLATLPAFLDDQREEQEEILREVLWRNSEYLHMVRTDTQGITRVAPRLEEPRDLSGRLHVSRALAGEGFVAGEYVRALVDGEAVFPYAVTLRDRWGQVSGALTLTYRLGAYRDVLDMLNISEGTIICMADHRGVTLFSNSPGCLEAGFARSLLFSPESPLRGGEDPLPREEEVLTGLYRNQEGQRTFVASRALRLSPLDPPFLYLLLAQPEEVVRRPAQRILLRNLLIMVCSGAGSLGIALFFSRLMLQSRLVYLMGAVSRISRGDLAARVSLNNAPRELLRLARAVDHMAEALEARSHERDRTEQELSASLEEREELLREVHHRVKNNMQLILSILHLEADYREDLESFVVQLESRLRAIASVHESLYGGSSFASIPLEELLEHLVVVSRGIYPDITVDIRMGSGNARVHLDQAVPLALVVNELLANAALHGAGSDGVARISIFFREISPGDERGEGGFCLEVHDGGPGFGADFGGAQALSMGMILLHALATQLGGTLEFSRSEPCGGARVVLGVPARQERF